VKGLGNFFPQTSPLSNKVLPPILISSTPCGNNYKCYKQGYFGNVKYGLAKIKLNTDITMVFIGGYIIVHHGTHPNIKAC
jgi:hypothetical protein